MKHLFLAALASANSLAQLVVAAWAQGNLAQGENLAQLAIITSLLFFSSLLLHLIACDELENYLRSRKARKEETQ